jgi:hypothetical protein
MGFGAFFGIMISHSIESMFPEKGVGKSILVFKIKLEIFFLQGFW